MFKNFNVRPFNCILQETKQMSRSLLLTLDTKYAKDDASTVSTSTLSSISNDGDDASTTSTSSTSNINTSKSSSSSSSSIIENSIEQEREEDNDVLIASPFLGIKVILISSLQLEAIIALVLALSIFVSIIIGFLLLNKRRKQKQTDRQLLLIAEEIPQQTPASSATSAEVEIIRSTLEESSSLHCPKDSFYYCRKT